MDNVIQINSGPSEIEAYLTLKERHLSHSVLTISFSDRDLDALGEAFYHAGVWVEKHNIHEELRNRLKDDICTNLRRDLKIEIY